MHTGEKDMIVRFALNGREVSADVRPAQSLLETLRALGCHSVRGACDTSGCGVCTVWVDETPVLSCSYPAARAQGRCVTTIEGVREEAEELVRTLADEGAEQCGFCSPGLLMAALAMLREYDDPTEEEIRTYLAGNLCRCSGYQSQARAFRTLLERRRAHA